jgi:tetratricopeptide (TPR) repeat protein
MNIATILKKTALSLLIILVFVSLYFGAYLPYKEAKAFISTARSLQSVRSIDELKTRFDSVLTIGSPVAEDEVVGFILGQLSNVLRTNPPEEIGRITVDYAEEVAVPVLTNPSSPELTKTVLKLGNIHQMAWLLYGDKNYRQKAEELYLQGLEISPNRSQFLYDLFELYLSAGEREKAAEIQEEIIRFWPGDLRIQGVVL